jgi:hypothetical protein
LLFYLQDICIVVGHFFFIGPGWLNELDSWITQQFIQAYHQCGVGSRPALEITKKGALDFIWIPAVFLLSLICSCIDKKQAMQGLSIEHLSIYYVYE